MGAYWLVNGIRRALVQADGVAGQIAAGDLRAEWQMLRHDEFGQSLLSLQAMSQSLGSMIHDVRDSGDAIAQASAEIASGNQDLSQRTQITASHLQQAVSAMLQLKATLQQTAGSGQQAAGLADQASGVAQRGGAVVGQVVNAMNDIYAGSQKIADTTGVIDSIAFQTNILPSSLAPQAQRVLAASRPLAAPRRAAHHTARLGTFGLRRGCAPARRIGGKLTRATLVRMAHGVWTAQTYRWGLMCISCTTHLRVERSKRW